MNRITVLKANFLLNDEIIKTEKAILLDEKEMDWDGVSNGTTSLISYKHVKGNSIEITDEEIENEVNQRNKGFSVGKHIHKSDFLACWEYIKQRINQ